MFLTLPVIVAVSRIVDPAGATTRPVMTIVIEAPAGHWVQLHVAFGAAIRQASFAPPPVSVADTVMLEASRPCVASEITL